MVAAGIWYLELVQRSQSGKQHEPDRGCAGNFVARRECKSHVWAISRRQLQRHRRGDIGSPYRYAGLCDETQLIITFLRNAEIRSSGKLHHDRQAPSLRRAREVTYETPRSVYCFAVLLGAAQVQATLLTWRLENVNFDDGGTAIGFFRYDPPSPPCSFDGCIGVVPDFDIATSPGFAFPNEYQPQAAGGRAFIVFAAPTGIGFGGVSGFGGTQLNLLFGESLPPEGGIVRIASGSNENLADLDSSASRQIVSAADRPCTRGSQTAPYLWRLWPGRFLLGLPATN